MKRSAENIKRDNILHLEVMMDENGMDEEYLAGVLTQLSWLLKDNKQVKAAELFKELANELAEL